MPIFEGINDFYVGTGFVLIAMGAQILYERYISPIPEIKTEHQEIERYLEANITPHNSEIKTGVSPESQAKIEDIIQELSD